MNPSFHYVLDERGEPKPERDLLVWGRWFENGKARMVAEKVVGNLRVSTVFLGLDHNFGGEGPPIVWETLVFRGKTWKDVDGDRCSGSREQALAMHQKFVDRAKLLQRPDRPSHFRSRRFTLRQSKFLRRRLEKLFKAHNLA